MPDVAKTAPRPLSAPLLPRLVPALRRRLANASLFSRVLALNTGILLVAGLALALSPATVSSPVLVAEGAVLAAGVAAMVVLNAFLVRRAIAPIERLSSMMSRVDPLRPGLRIPEYGEDREVVELTVSFNRMLERLERERRESARRALEAQEAERLRIALELHDEVGQSLTATLLQLDRAASDVPEHAAIRLRDVKESTRATLDEVRMIARRLRPEALDDLGLHAALGILSDEIAASGSVRVHLHVDSSLPSIPPDVEVVIYRVAQESLTNVIRHADASHVGIDLRLDGDAVLLRVSDDGRGMPEEAGRGSGLRGMRERAVLVRGRIDIGASREGGVEVALRIPRDALHEERCD